MNFTKGQTVYLKPCGNNARYGRLEPKQYIVKTVGRKYLTVWDGNNEYANVKFNLTDDLRQATEYCADWELYLSLQEIEDEREHNDLTGKIRLIFSNYGKVNLTLEQLRLINDIVSK